MPVWLDSTNLAYLTGSLGILLEWRSYHVANSEGFRRWSALAAILWSIQYLLLDAWTAAINMALTAVRTISSQFITGKVAIRWLTGAFVVLFGWLTYYSWQGPVSLLSGFAVINTTLALFYLGNRSMRLVLLASSLAWLANDLYWQAWPALVAETVSIIINVRTIYLLASPQSR